MIQLMVIKLPAFFVCIKRVLGRLKSIAFLGKIATKNKIKLESLILMINISKMAIRQRNFLNK